MAILRFITDVLSNPAFILAIIAALGLITQKKSGSDVLKGTIKTALGFLILTAGSGVIVGALTPFSDMFTGAFHLTGVVAEDNSLVAAAMKASAEIGTGTALIMVLSFLINVVLARITPYKYIFLTGHMMLSFAGTMAITLVGMGIHGWKMILIGSIIQGVSMVVFPAFSQPIVRKVTGNDLVAFGFWGSSWITLSALVTKFLRGKSEPKSTEEMNFPKSLDFLKDMAILMSIIMVIVYLVAALADGKTAVDKMAGGTNWILFSIIQALTFVAGVLILLQGVRMFLGEIIPAFKGIGEKIVPGARPALDVPIFYSFAPIATTLGFLAALVGALLATFISAAIAPVAILPSAIGIFFMGAAAGVFGNKVAGRRGAVAAGFILGLTWSLLVAFAYPLVDVTKYGISGLWFASPDAIIVVIIIRLVGHLFGI